jgi:TrpR family trp operon transcriptional repressor
MNSNKEQSAKNLQELIDILTLIEDRDLMSRFFDELFTPAEKKAFSLRWELVKNLYRGNTQREIASELGVSLCKITRGAKILKKKDSAFRAILDKWSSSDQPDNLAW